MMMAQVPDAEHALLSLNGLQLNLTDLANKDISTHDIEYTYDNTNP